MTAPDLWFDAMPTAEEADQLLKAAYRRLLVELQEPGGPSGGAIEDAQRAVAAVRASHPSASERRATATALDIALMALADTWEDDLRAIAGPLGGFARLAWPEGGAP